jgi:uncharacterized protein (TIGR02145 family)
MGIDNPFSVTHINLLDIHMPLTLTRIDSGVNEISFAFLSINFVYLNCLTRLNEKTGLTAFLFFTPVVIPFLPASGQRPAIELNFTAVNNLQYTSLDSIYVINRTQHCDTMLYWPDTVLVLGNVSIGDMNPVNNNRFVIYQNFPNPVTDQTSIKLWIPDKGITDLRITDLLGRQLISLSRELGSGSHLFTFTPGKERIYLFTAIWRSVTQRIKIVNSTRNRQDACSLDYVGKAGHVAVYKSSEITNGFVFYAGDTLLYVGFTDTLISGILDAPVSSTNYTFQFATNIPCPGMPTVTYEGQVYNTIQVFSQCWLKENLNAGTMILNDQQMTDNGVVEKYCLLNITDSCSVYGGLYQWDEVMQYITTSGSQGICPSGWHIPTDEEWKILTGAVDSQHIIGDPMWDIWDWCGYDAGKNLKSRTHWLHELNNTDLFGFSALGSGYLFLGEFYNLYFSACFWTSDNYDSNWIWYRGLHDHFDVLLRNNMLKNDGCSVRCLRDN